jgi:acetate kinase
MSCVHYILCINSGSSSLKFALYRMAYEDETLLARGAVERIGLDGGRMWIRAGKKGPAVEVSRDVQNHRAAVWEAFRMLDGLHLARPSAIGHRIVHGGPAHFRPVRVDPALLAELKSLMIFAPLHLPAHIKCIEAVTGHFPELPQIACFDTAFHRSMPELAQRFPLPQKYWEEGIRRYGFHGLSYEYVLEALGKSKPERIIIAHLGNGASMAAIYDGCPVDTTMGFTPTGGFLMGTRTGDLDPGLLVYLMSERKCTAQQIEHLVNDQAGLLGISGTSPDMKTLLARREHDSLAALAIDMFCYQVRKSIGALAATLGGLDLLVFTGGIGEKAAPVRLEVCHGLAYLGIRVDENRNAAHGDPISIPTSTCAVRIIPTNEDLVIARHSFRLLTL